MVELKTMNGVAMPKIGFGTFPFQGQTMADMMVAALSCGYRLFDTADDYRGESGIGLGLKQLKGMGVAREDIFIQTKISDNRDYQYCVESRICPGV